MTKIMNNNYGGLRKQFKDLRDLYLYDQNDEHLDDISLSWVNFLKKDKRWKKNSYIKWNLGSRGGGKTADVFKETNILLENQKRIVQFWKAPIELIQNINKCCPEDRKGRYETIDKLRDIKFNAIFVIDEGIIGANAKEALKKEMRNLIKFLSKTRHYNIIGIINSVSLGILLQFRDTIDIVAYRRLPKIFLKNNSSKDIVLKEYAGEINSLKDWQCLLFSSYKRFDREGLVSMKYEKYCVWFNDNLSMYQQSTNPDVAFDENKILLDKHKKIVHWLIKSVEDKFNGKHGFNNFSMWLYRNFNDIYFDNKSYLRTIFNLYVHYLDESYIVKNSDIVGDNSKLAELLYNLKKMIVFYDFSVVQTKAIEKVLLYEKKYKKKAKNLVRNMDIYKNKMFGKKMTVIAKEFDLCESYISDIVLKIEGRLKKNDSMNKKYPLGSINYYKGHILEEEYAKFLTGTNLFDGGVKVLGGIGEPDVIAYKNNEVYVFSLKNINFKTHNNLTPDDVKAEILYCQENESANTEMYMLVVVYDNNNNVIHQIEYDYKNINKKIDLKQLVYKSK